MKSLAALHRNIPKTPNHKPLNSLLYSHFPIHYQHFTLNPSQRQSTTTANMSKLLVVFGSTGQQGGSIIETVLNDSELSKQYKLRAVTRDPSKPVAQALEKRGVEVVKGDVDDKDSVKQALKGANFVYIMTNTIYEREAGKEKELAQEKLLADEAVAAGAEYIIHSSMSHPEKISSGKNAVSIFDVKAEGEIYMRKLPIKSAFYAPGSFYQNFLGQQAPRPNGDGTFSFNGVYNPDTPLPLIDIAADTGKFVGAILADPEKYNGKLFSAASGIYTMEEVAATLSKVSGKKVTYNQLPDEVMKKFMRPGFDEEVMSMLRHIRDYLYFGPDQKTDVEWTSAQARGKLTSLEEFFKSSMPKLE